MDALNQTQASYSTVSPASSYKRGLSGSTLKLIALVTMLIDHVGAALLGRYLMASGYMDAALSGVDATLAWLQENGTLYWTYWILRLIGRIAFPIFCFLLIEGFQKTHDVKKYALRLGAFALISEIPFDLAFKAEILEFTYQNVFFTLFLGLLAMICYDAIWKRHLLSAKTGDRIVKLLLSAVVLLFFCVAAEFLHTDYASAGVLCITALYAFRRRKPLQILAGCITFLWELTAPLAFLFIGFYNGRRGLRLKYVFYLFYPVHLLLIYLICMLLGVASYPAM